MWGKPVFSGWDKFGTLISKFEDKWWDIDIKNITVSHCDHTKCNLSVQAHLPVLCVGHGLQELLVPLLVPTTSPPLEDGGGPRVDEEADSKG